MISAVHSKVTKPPSKESSKRRERRESTTEEGVWSSSLLAIPPRRRGGEKVQLYRLTDWYVQALQQGNNDGARIYASNAIRKKSESLNLLRLASRIDAVASRVETATTMRQVTGNMTSVVRGMDKAMESMNVERVRPSFFPFLLHIIITSNPI